MAMSEVFNRRYVFFCSPADGSSSVQAPAVSLREIVRHVFLKIISDLRYGTRPSLVGEVADLTPKMEEAFRTGRFRIVFRDEAGGIYQLQHVFGGSTVIFPSWTEIGLREKPGRAEMMLAHRAYNAWKEREVGFPQGDLSAAMEDLKSEFTDAYNIAIANAKTAGEIYHVMELLRLLPERVLRSGAIKKLAFVEERGGGDPRYASYDKKEVKVIDPYSMWDRHLFTAYLMHELGHAVYDTLDASQRSSLKALFGVFWKSGAVFSGGFMGIDESVRINLQGSEDEFFAENFMHYLILGQTIFSWGGVHQQPLRHELYTFYQRLITPVKI
jgi:hypothetical protein